MSQNLQPYPWTPDATLEAALPVILRWAADDPLISQVWAFGSRAGSRRRGPPRPDSDLGVGFIVSASDRMGRRHAAGEMRGHGIGIKARDCDRLAAELGLPIDLQFTHPRLAPHAYARLGRCIYRRSRVAAQ